MEVEDWDIGGLTYGYAKEEGLEEGIIFGDVFENFPVIGDVYEDRQGIFGYGLEKHCQLIRPRRPNFGGISTNIVILH